MMWTGPTQLEMLELRIWKHGKSKVIVYFVNLNLITIRAIIESLSLTVNKKMYKYFGEVIT